MPITCHDLPLLVPPTAQFSSFSWLKSACPASGAGLLLLSTYFVPFFSFPAIQLTSGVKSVACMKELYTTALWGLACFVDMSTEFSDDASDMHLPINHK